MMGIRPYQGEFLLAPWPLHMDLVACAYGCAYCFTRFRPKRAQEHKPRTVTQWRQRIASGFGGITRWYLNRKAVVCCSNTSDPFSPNHALARPLMEACVEVGIPLMYQTKGGEAAAGWAKDCPKATWYVTITGDREAMRKQYEPNAPTYKERRALVEHLRACGHTVILGCNPHIPAWWKDRPGFARWAEGLDVAGIWIGKLHIRPAASWLLGEKAWARLKPLADSVRGENREPYLCEASRFCETSLPVFPRFGDEKRFWDRARAPYPATSMIPTVFDWWPRRKNPTEPTPVCYRHFEAMFAPHLPPIRASEFKCYGGSNQGMAGKGQEACKAGTREEALKFLWMNPVAGDRLWGYRRMAYYGISVAGKMHIAVESDGFPVLVSRDRMSEVILEMEKEGGD